MCSICLYRNVSSNCHVSHTTTSTAREQFALIKAHLTAKLDARKNSQNYNSVSTETITFRVPFRETLTLMPNHWRKVAAWNTALKAYTTSSCPFSLHLWWWWWWWSHRHHYHPLSHDSTSLVRKWYMNAAFLASSSCFRCLRARCDPNSLPAEDGARNITSPNMVAVETEEGNKWVFRKQETLVITGEKLLRFDWLIDCFKSS